MPTLFLIRHAEPESPFRWSGPDRARALTALGREQAAWAAATLEGEGVTEIRTSPYERCIQTVQPIADAAEIALILDDSLGIGGRMDLPPGDGVFVLCGHSDGIPLALTRLGIACRACARGSIWRVELDLNGIALSHSYCEPKPGQGRGRK